MTIECSFTAKCALKERDYFFQSGMTHSGKSRSTDTQVKISHFHVVVKDHGCPLIALDAGVRMDCHPVRSVGAVRLCRCFLLLCEVVLGIRRVWTLPPAW